MNYFVKCTGYTQNREKYFTVGKIYEVNDNKITADNGYVYNENNSFRDVIKGLNSWYAFEKVEFKAGDRVIATDNLGIHKNAPCTIVNPTPSRNSGNYWVKFKDGTEFYATVHSIISEQKIVITTDGVKYVTAKLYAGDTVKVAEAKCAPEDTFDFMVGAKLAVERLNKKEEPPKPKYYNGKVVCIKTDYPWWTVGKVYEVKNGIIAANDGKTYPAMKDEPYRDVEDVRHAGYGESTRHNSKNEFIPFVED